MVHVAPPGGWTYEPLHPDKWTDQMLKAWKDASHHKEAGLTKRDLSLVNIDNAKPGELVNTPRSLQACLYLGIDPEEIQFRDFDYFTERGLPKELQKMKFDYFENERKRKLELLINERNRIIAEHDDGQIFLEDVQSGQGGGGDGGKPSDSVAKALKKAEAAARRTEIERARKKQIEETFQKMVEDAKRVAALQLKQETEQAAAKRAKEKEFAAQQAAIEAKKREEEEALEKAAIALAAKQYAEELKLNAERAKAAKKARKAAIALAHEKAEKQAAFQKEIEMMQERVLQAAIEQNKKLAAKDAERKKRQAIKKEEIRKQNAIARAKAEKRQALVLQAYYDALKKKRDDFYAKNAAMAARKAIMQVEIDKQIKEKIRMQKIAEKNRQRTFEQANARREKHIQEILDKSDHKAQIFNEYLKRREKERKKKNVQTNLEYSKAIVIVNQTTRKKALRRRQLLSHIEKATQKTRNLMETRLKIQKARQLAEAKAMWAQRLE